MSSGPDAALRFRHGVKLPTSYLLDKGSETKAERGEGAVLVQD